MKSYKYLGNPGRYNGMIVTQNEIYKFEKVPNPKLFRLVETVEQTEIKTVKQTETKPDVYKIMEEIKGIGPKMAAEIAEEYSDLEELKKDIENGNFSVGGMSEKKIELIKRELKIGE